ncbi:hypothetical protein HOG98_05695 [bacterium]|jgi:hypothetical protein|nr:hypothetical protein [bacterium]
MKTSALFSKSPHLLEILNQFFISRKLSCSCFGESDKFEKYIADTSCFPDLIVLDCDSPNCVNNLLTATNNLRDKLNENIYLLLLVDKTKFRDFQSIQGNLEIFTLLKPFLYKDLERIYEKISTDKK